MMVVVADAEALFQDEDTTKGKIYQLRIHNGKEGIVSVFWDGDEGGIINAAYKNENEFKKEWRVGNEKTVPVSD